MADGFFLSQLQVERIARALQASEQGVQPRRDTVPTAGRAVDIKIGKADAAIIAGSSGTFQWWKSASVGVGETDQTENFTAYDWFATGFAQDEKVLLVRPIPSPRWYAISLAGETGKTKVDAGDTLDYLEDQFIDLNGTPAYDSAKDLEIEVDQESDGGDPKIRLYIDISKITGYTAGNHQFLYHAPSGGIKWLDMEEC